MPGSHGRSVPPTLATVHCTSFPTDTEVASSFRAVTMFPFRRAVDPQMLDRLARFADRLGDPPGAAVEESPLPAAARRRARW